MYKNIYRSINSILTIDLLTDSNHIIQSKSKKFLLVEKNIFYYID